MNPFNIRQNMYGNADYDVRQNFSANYVYTTPKMKGMDGAVGNWTIAGTIFAHTGLPFTVVDSATGALLNSFGYGGANLNAVTFANQTGGWRGQLQLRLRQTKQWPVPRPGQQLRVRQPSASAISAETRPMDRATSIPT